MPILPKPIDERHLSGQAAELRVAFALANFGYTISKPWLTQCEYDLVVEIDKDFQTVQVKKATWSKAGNFSYLQVRLSRDKRRLVEGVDLFAFTDNDKVWIVPTPELVGMTSVCLLSDNPDYKRYTKYDPEKWIL